jgi:hypothetical protein
LRDNGLQASSFGFKALRFKSSPGRRGA